MIMDVSVSKRVGCGVNVKSPLRSKTYAPANFLLLKNFLQT